jgi:hypothetical protein
MAAPDSVIAQDGNPGDEPAAVADQVTVEPARVPLALPATASVWRQVAVNVPAPVVADESVTVQVKFVHVSSTEVLDDTDCQVPPRKLTVSPVGEVLPFCRNSKQPAFRNTAKMAATKTFFVIASTSMRTLLLIGSAGRRVQHFFI